MRFTYLLVFLCCFVSCGFFPLTLDEHLSAGLKSYRKNDYKVAAGHFEYILSKDGTNVLARNNLASVYIRMGHLSDALFELERVIKSNPNYPESRYNMGIVYVKLEMWPEALYEFRKSLNLSFSSKTAAERAVLYAYIGMCLDETGEWGEAATALETAILLKSDDKASRLRLAHLYYYMGNYLDAENEVEVLEARGFKVNPVFKEKISFYLKPQKNDSNLKKIENQRRKRVPSSDKSPLLF